MRAADATFFIATGVMQALMQLALIPITAKLTDGEDGDEAGGGGGGDTSGYSSGTQGSGSAGRHEARMSLQEGGGQGRDEGGDSAPGFGGGGGSEGEGEGGTSEGAATRRYNNAAVGVRWCDRLCFKGSVDALSPRPSLE